MGRRDEPELTPTDEELAAAEASLRRTLARYSEPAPAAPPPDLVARVLATLPRERAPGIERAPAAPRLGPAAGWAVAALSILLLAIGAWGVLVNSLAPASVAGGPADGLGQLLLVLTLAAKPLVNLLASAGATAALVVLTAVGGAWLWWRIVSTTPFAAAVEIPR
jgi:hypothetical protein